MDANLNALALKSSSLLDERAEFVSLLKMQQMVRVTCLEVLQGAPSQVEAYRKEVNELTNLVKGYLDEVREMRANGNKPEPSSPSTASIRSVSVPDSPGPLTLLDASFEEAPETQWYEHKPLPRFSVRVPGAADGEVVLSVSLLNGRGLAEEQKANGTGELIAGDRTAVVRGGVAEWANLRICEPSSKHYGAFTMIISAIRSPDGLGVEELRSQPLTVQVGRMWSKRRKAETDLGPEDPITQIPGVGARYVQRLQLHGISTIGQFSAMAATAPGRDSLCKLCKGDNPRNSLNQQKLQAMIDAADKVCSVFDAHGNVKRARGGNALADGLSVMTTASALSGSSPLPEGEPSFSMEELMLLASPDTVDFSPGTPKLGPLVADGAPNGFASFALAENDDDDEIEPRMRRMHVSAVNDAAAYDDAASAISILPPKQVMMQGNGAATIAILPPKKQVTAANNGLSGFAALDALAEQPESPSSTPPPTTSSLALSLRGAWRGDAAAAASGVSTDRFGCTPVHVAALAGHGHVITDLLSQPSFAECLDAPAVPMGGATPLLLAACRGASANAAAHALLDAGALPNAVLRGNVSAAHLAAWSGNAELLSRLIEMDVGLATFPTDAGLGPLEYACLAGNSECIDVLMTAGVIGGTEGAPLTPLHCAALSDDVESVERLLSAAPEQIDAYGASGWLPIHAAVAAAAMNSVSALVRAGASLDAPTADGDATAYEIAMMHADEGLGEAIATM